MDVNFDAIRCYNDDEVQPVIAKLLAEKKFVGLLQFLFPDKPIEAFIEELKKLDNVFDFQYNVIYPFLENLLVKTSTGLTNGGFESVSKDDTNFYITNHRDIVLDPSFINVVLYRHKLNTCEISAGDNLLAYEWIEHLLRLNKTFIVNRNISVRQLLDVSKRLSSYIHHVQDHKKQSIWMAQREGRAKDSDDRTAVALLKMLNMGGEFDFITNMKSLNFLPVCISYEYDPCDYLKAMELINKKNDPSFKKSQSDDLESMGTGILGYKGHVHLEACGNLEEDWPYIESLKNKNAQFDALANTIDKKIHANYKLYPGNYIAYDLLNPEEKRFTNNYTAADEEVFQTYLNKQMAKAAQCKEEDKDELRRLILIMYANPTKNKMIALQED